MDARIMISLFREGIQKGCLDGEPYSILSYPAVIKTPCQGWLGGILHILICKSNTTYRFIEISGSHCVVAWPCCIFAMANIAVIEIYCATLEGHHHLATSFYHFQMQNMPILNLGF